MEREGEIENEGGKEGKRESKIYFYRHPGLEKILAENSFGIELNLDRIF